MLKVKLLCAAAKAPTVAHPGEDLGYDIYSAETVTLEGRGHAIVSTGIAIECTSPTGEPMGALLRDKSSMAARRLALTGGVIDSGYRGE
ncbi:MAG TPA: dUTP diphosphatase, partial [Candidatus Angelobacter sp.]|nr:dUTP diphosphatase [Candidatus Angelobacter sp.]